jgi:hypothetical protein
MSVFGRFSPCRSLPNKVGQDLNEYSSLAAHSLLGTFQRAINDNILSIINLLSDEDPGVRRAAVDLLSTLAGQGLLSRPALVQGVIYFILFRCV